MDEYTSDTKYHTYCPDKRDRLVERPRLQVGFTQKQLGRIYVKKKLSKRIKAHIKSRQDCPKGGNFQPIGQRTVGKVFPEKEKAEAHYNLLLSLLVLSQRLKVLRFVKVSNLLSSIFIISWNDDGVLDSGMIIVGEQRWRWAFSLSVLQETSLRPAASCSLPAHSTHGTVAPRLPALSASDDIKQVLARARVRGEAIAS